MIANNLDDIDGDRAIVAEFTSQLRAMRLPKVCTQEGREAVERIGGALCDIWIEMKPFTHPKAKAVTQ